MMGAHPHQVILVLARRLVIDVFEISKLKRAIAEALFGGFIQHPSKIH